MADFRLLPLDFNKKQYKLQTANLFGACDEWEFRREPPPPTIREGEEDQLIPTSWSFDSFSDFCRTSCVWTLLKLSLLGLRISPSISLIYTSKFLSGTFNQVLTFMFSLDTKLKSSLSWKANSPKAFKSFCGEIKVIRLNHNYTPSIPRQLLIFLCNTSCLRNGV